MNTPQPYPPLFSHLMLVGLLGSIYRCHEPARVIEQFIEATTVDAQSYRLWKAIACGMGGQAAAICAELESHIEEHPGDDAAKVALGVSLMFAGDGRWKGWLDNVLATSDDQVARTAAKGAMDFLAQMTR